MPTNKKKYMIFGRLHICSNNLDIFNFVIKIFKLVETGKVKIKKRTANLAKSEIILYIIATKL